ncbi:MAG: flagellar motor switch protein FliM [Gammaproteobacteria bacterium]|nr:flagellar motor switch protein FliM [Gammaproteobacteria bacterium]
MSDKDILSQDEIDALLHGVDSGHLIAETEAPLNDNIARPFDIANQDRIVRGRLPTLEMINERFARYLRVSVFSMLGRSPEVSVDGVQMLKFGDYIHALYVPTSLSIVRIAPLRGRAIVNMDSKLVFAIVDNYFGGDGRFQAKIEGREFTPTELRVVRIVADSAFEDFKRAWQPVMDLQFDYVGHEVNPHLASIATPSELVVVSTFNIELEGGGGELHMTMPYSMVEPIRQLLDAGIQSDRSDTDTRWNRALREQVFSSQVEISTSLLELTVSLKQLTELKPGDILPIDPPSLVTASTEGIPLFRGQYGESRGNAALRIAELIRFYDTEPSAELGNDK